MIENQGYKKDSPFKGLKSIKINSDVITMDGVEHPLLITDAMGNKKIYFPNTGLHKVQPPIIEQMLQSGGDFTALELQQKIDSINAVLPKFRVLPDDPDYIVKKDKWQRENKNSLQERKNYQLALQSLSFVSPNGEGESSSKSKSKTKLYEFKSGGVSVYPEITKNAANAEVEDGETMMSPEGILYQFKGKKHSEGGIPVLLEQGSKIFSEHLKAPKSVSRMVLDKKTDKKYSYAELSKKFKTEPQLDTLENPNSDEFQKNTAYLKLVGNHAKLNTIFNSQEEVKQQENSTRKFQSGGALDLSSISNRFQKINDNTFLDPETGAVYRRGDKTGRYTRLNVNNTLPEVVVNSTPEANKNQFAFTSSGQTLENPYTIQNMDEDMKKKVQSMFVSPEYAREAWEQGFRDPILNGLSKSKKLINDSHNTYGQRLEVPATNKTPLSPSSPSPLNYKDLIRPNPDGLKDSSWLNYEHEDFSAESSLSPEDTGLVKNPNGTYSYPSKSSKSGKSSVTKKRQPFVFNQGDPSNPYDPSNDFPQQPDTQVLDRESVVEEVTPTTLPSDFYYNEPETISGSEKALKNTSAVYKQAKSILPGSKVLGTLMDIGLALSDKLTVDAPNYRDNRKYPLFSRFVGFDDKDVSKQYAKSADAIQNSNVPESVKQAQLAALNANLQDYQAKIDFGNAQRYEDKLNRDTEKLQGYLDRNVDIATQDLDVYRQKMARVNRLVDEFKAQRKSRVVNSIRDYLDYAETTKQTNEFSENFEVNPWSGKVNYKGQKNNEFKTTEDLMSQYKSSGKNSIPLDNGATLVIIGNKAVILDKDGKATKLD